MEHELSQTDIIINIAIQLANIVLFFFFFIKFAGNAISRALDEKIIKEKKLADADKEYASLIESAQAEKEKILADALHHKRNIVAEATQLAKQEQEKILEKANREAALIIKKAQQDAESQQRDIESHFEHSVKQSALMLVKKLFASNPSVSETYLSGLVDEFTSSYKK